MAQESRKNTEGCKQVLSKSFTADFSPYSLLECTCQECKSVFIGLEDTKNTCEQCTSLLIYSRKLSYLCTSIPQTLEPAQSKLMKVKNKFQARISDIQTVLNKIKHSTKFTSNSLEDYSESLTHLSDSQTILNLQYTQLNTEIQSLKSFISQLKLTESEKSSELAQKESFHKSIKKQLITLRNDLATFQDENYENIKKLEDIKTDLKTFHLRSHNRKKTKLKSMIAEDSQKLEVLLEENSKIEEFIQFTEGSSRTGSIATIEEVSTNNEEEESIKEISLKLQEQQTVIWQMKLEMEKKKRQDLSSETCKCFIL